MSNLPKTQEFNQFKPAPNPPGVTTPGIHTGEPYVPSSDMAWGARGKWEGKAWTDVSFERQVRRKRKNCEMECEHLRENHLFFSCRFCL